MKKLYIKFNVFANFLSPKNNRFHLQVSIAIVLTCLVVFIAGPFSSGTFGGQSQEKIQNDETVYLAQSDEVEEEELQQQASELEELEEEMLNALDEKRQIEEELEYWKFQDDARRKVAELESRLEEIEEYISTLWERKEVLSGSHWRKTD